MNQTTTPPAPDMQSEDRIASKDYNNVDQTIFNGSRFEERIADHDPSLYSPETEAFSVETLHDIGSAEIGFFHEHGYLSVRRAFSEREVSDAMNGLVSLIMGERPDFQNILFEAAAKDTLETMNAEQRMDSVRKLDRFVDFEPRLKALSHHKVLCSVISSLMGGHSPSMIQDMALIKPPALGREKPWHQDHAFFNYPMGTPIVGVWIALDEATVANGCMQLLPGLHKDPIIHFKRRDWQICDNFVLGRHSVAAPLKPGGLLFFDGLLPHGTPHNLSGLRRRALQYHYIPEGVNKIPTEERLSVFGSEGKDVSC